MMMDFKKKLRTRLYFGLAFIVIGIALIIISLVTGNANEFLSPYGTALLVIGLVRIRNYFAVTRNDETILKQQIAETDERNLAISNKARSWSFTIYVIVASIAIIVLQILGYSRITSIVGITVCTLILIYWVCYFIIRKKY